MNHGPEASCEDEQYESNSCEELPVTADPSLYGAPVSSTAIGKLIDSHQVSHLTLVYLSKELEDSGHVFVASSSYHS